MNGRRPTKDILPPELLEAMRLYIDVRLEEAFTDHDPDVDAYRLSIRRQDSAAAWERVEEANNQPV